MYIFWHGVQTGCWLPGKMRCPRQGRGTACSGTVSGSVQKSGQLCRIFGCVWIAPPRVAVSIGGGKMCIFHWKMNDCGLPKPGNTHFLRQCALFLAELVTFTTKMRETCFCAMENAHFSNESALFCLEESRLEFLARMRKNTHFLDECALFCFIF